MNKSGAELFAHLTSVIQNVGLEWDDASVFIGDGGPECKEAYKLAKKVQLTTCECMARGLLNYAYDGRILFKTLHLASTACYLSTFRLDSSNFNYV